MIGECKAGLDDSIPASSGARGLCKTTSDAACEFECFASVNAGNALTSDVCSISMDPQRATPGTTGITAGCDPRYHCTGDKCKMIASMEQSGE